MPYMGLGQAMAGGWIGQQQGMQNSSGSDQLAMYQQLYNTYTTAIAANSSTTATLYNYLAQAVASPVEAPKESKKKSKVPTEETPLAWLDRRVTEMRVAL